MLCHILDNPYSSYVKVDRIDCPSEVNNFISLSCSNNNKNLVDCNI